uniref:Uncharacterized protein n=1 Tax=Rhizophora mucronata TaxID=61149 RepID=A0A2P2PXP6_RHIMU
MQKFQPYFLVMQPTAIMSTRISLQIFLQIYTSTSDASIINVHRYEKMVRCFRPLHSTFYC